MLSLGHKKLHVYQIAINMVKEVYNLTNGFPFDERFGLVSQLRRAAVSVCSNIAEGASRKSALDRKRFYEIARGSLVEVHAAFDVATELNYTSKERLKEPGDLIIRNFQMISNMISRCLP